MLTNWIFNCHRGKSAIARLTLILLLPLFAIGCVEEKNIPPQQKQREFLSGWNNVTIGGGGYVTGIYLHPQAANLAYIRTDMGGFYRWNSFAESWIPLTDGFTRKESQYYGGEALALDPNNPDVVYIAAGKYLWGKPGTIFKSSDRGKTWVKSDLQVPMGGNQEMRWTGNRLAVNPFDGNVLLLGSRKNGLWRSQDGGMTWQSVRELSATPKAGIGILAIAFDPQVRDRAYLSAYGDGIYRSSDAGKHWQKLPGSPAEALKLAIASDRTLYVTHANGVSKYLNNTWEDITPDSHFFLWRDRPMFNGLTLDPKDRDRLAVSLGNTSSTEIYHSRDGGLTWKKKRSKINKTVPWWPDRYFSNHVSAIQFDPQVRDRFWLTDWYGIWRTDNFNANPVLWKNYPKGHEQIVTFDLVSPPSGALLLSALADVEGFYHNRLDTYPSTRFGYGRNESFQDTYSIDYCANHPQHLVRVGGDRWNSTYGGATSTDGGLTWKKFPHFPKAIVPIRVAVSATNPDRFVVTLRERPPLYTDDGGKSWQTVKGLPNGGDAPWNWSQPLVADAVKGNQFYYYDKGTVYRSNDGGLSFYPIHSQMPKESWHSLQTMPGVAEEIWIGLNRKGLYRSPDGGKTFSKIPTVETAHLFSFGKAPPGSQIPALYLYGKIRDRPEGIFWSGDRGQTWTSIGNSQTPIGNQPNVMEASKQRFGLVFIGTNGRGIYYRVLD